ncbi:MAG: hypothetical protein U0746_18590 [Gemmataceae bacterium]
MPFTVMCPTCSAKEQVEDAMAGRHVTCSTCTRRFVAEAKPAQPPAKAKVGPAAAPRAAPRPASPPPPPPQDPRPAPPSFDAPRPAPPPAVDEPAEAESGKPGRRRGTGRRRKGKTGLCHLALALGCAALSIATAVGWTIVPLILGTLAPIVAMVAFILGERDALRAACSGIGTMAGVVSLVVVAFRLGGGGPRAVPMSAEEKTARQYVVFPDGRQLLRTPKTDDWVDAEKTAVEVNGVYVGVLAAIRERVEFRVNDKPVASPEGQCLVIRLRVMPAERIPKEVRFTPWSDGTGEKASVTDAEGKTASLVPFPKGATTAKYARQTEFFPAMYVEDVLVFPAPEAEGDVKLTVPAEALGGVGPIRFVLKGGKVGTAKPKPATP